MGHESPESGTAVGEPELIYVPGIPADSGLMSASDGSPIEKLGAALDAMKIDRGRTRVQTPVQGHGPVVDVDWYVSTVQVSPQKKSNHVLLGHHYYYQTRRSCTLPESKSASCDDAQADSSPSPCRRSSPRFVS